MIGHDVFVRKSHGNFGNGNVTTKTYGHIGTGALRAWIVVADVEVAVVSGGEGIRKREAFWWAGEDDFWISGV